MEGSIIMAEARVPTPEELGETAERETIRVGLDFEVKDSGVFWLKETEEEGIKRIRLCARLDILASTRDENGSAWGSLVRWRDADGRVKTWAMPRALLAGDGTGIIEALLDGGLDGIPVQRSLRLKLLEYLNQTSLIRAWCVGKIGWHESGGFILPDGAIGGGAEPVVFQSRGSFVHAFNVAGTFEDWQANVGRLAIGNTRLAFAIAAAFAAPLLYLADEENGGFHFRGDTSAGKTTALEAAGSVWGGGRAGYLQRWRATANALEAVAEAHNDALLILDEIGQAEPREVGEVSYALGNGQGKLRGARQGGNRPTAHYRILFLSSGERSLASMMGEAGKQVKGGQEVRLADILFLGDWENLHGFGSGADLSRHIKEASRRAYGTPIRAFLGRLNRLDRNELLRGLRTFRPMFAAGVSLAEDAPGEVRRVADRFALVAFAGETAIEAGILPWPPGEAERAAQACFLAWLDGRDTKGASDLERGFRQVRTFLGVNGASRFEPLRPDGDEASTALRIINRAGFTRKALDGQTEYLVLADVFRGEVCKGFDFKAIARHLEQRGYLVRGQDGRLTDRPRHPELGRPQVYAIRATIFDGEGGE